MLTSTFNTLYLEEHGPAKNPNKIWRETDSASAPGSITYMTVG